VTRPGPWYPTRWSSRPICACFTDVTEHEAWIGSATLELRPNAQVPAHLLAVREVVLGLHRTIDLTLAPGHIVHRYPGGQP